MWSEAKKLKKVTLCYNLFFPLESITYVIKVSKLLIYIQKINAKKVVHLQKTDVEYTHKLIKGIKHYD
jgi:CRISPR/Cas system-associated exonuclease Cas4 (RecB family)